MSWFRQRPLLTGFWICVGGITGAFAQDGTQIAAEEDEFQPWALGFTLQTDEYDSQSLFTTFNWGVTENTWLFASLGRSTSPADRADISTDDIVVGVDHSFGMVGTTLELEQWGESNAVESRDVRGSIYLHGDRYNVGIEHERRDIDLTFFLPGPGDRRIARSSSLTGEGTGIFFRADLTDWWRVYGSARQYDYSRRLEILPRLDILNFLSASTLTLANSFLDDEQYLGFEWRAGNKLINLGFGSNTSAVDSSELDFVSASFLFPVGYRVDIEFNLGRSDPDFAESSLYGGVMVLIYGGG